MYDIIAYYELLFEFENIDFAALCKWTEVVISLNLPVLILSISLRF